MKILSSSSNPGARNQENSGMKMLQLLAEFRLFLRYFTSSNLPVISLVLIIFVKSYSHYGVTYFYMITWWSFCQRNLTIPLKPPAFYTNNVALLNPSKPPTFWKSSVFISETLIVAKLSLNLILSGALSTFPWALQVS